MKSMREYGGVIVHRWFENGSGWACDPSIIKAGFCPPEMIELKNAVRNSNGKRVVCKVTGGVFWGEQVHDPECTDLKAIPRNPTILRLVYLPRVPAPEQEQEILKLLENEMNPTEPSQVKEMRIEIPPGLTRVQISKKRPAYLVVFVLALVVIVAIGIGLATTNSLSPMEAPRSTNSMTPTDEAPINTTGDRVEADTEMKKSSVHPKIKTGPKSVAESVRPTVNDEGIKEIEKGLRAWITQWPEADGQGDRNQKINRFFTTLSLSSNGITADMLKGIDAGTHWDIIFASRFPQDAPRNDQWTNEMLEGSINQVLKSFSRDPLLGEAKAANPVPDWSLSQKVKAVVDAADFEKWFVQWQSIHPLRESVVRQKFAFPLDSKPNEKIGDFVRTFCSRGIDKSPRDVATAKAALGLMKSWEINGLAEKDADSRPSFVCFGFLEFLKSGCDLGNAKPNSLYMEFAYIRMLKSKLDETLDGSHSPIAQAETVFTKAFKTRIAGSVDRKSIGILNFSQWKKQDRDGIYFEHSPDSGVNSFLQRLCEDDPTKWRN